jgi:hypothetical protein
MSYKDNADVHQVLDQQGASETMLTAYFKANREFSWAQSILYREFPEYAVWNPTLKKWKKRKQRTQVGRIISAHPAEGERYYLRVLLNHVAGATSYENLRTFDGVVYPTFREPNDVRGIWNKHLEAMSDDF